MAEHDISLNTAITETGNFRTAHSALSRGGRIPKAQILSILNQPECAGLKCYFSVPKTSESDNISIVFVGVDGSGNDMIGAGAVLKNSIVLCPPNCGNFNTLHNYVGS